MGFCRKCGHELADDVLFCNKCGEKTDLGLEQVPEMSKEDSIKLADTLREKYASAEKLSYEISENEKIIKKPLVVEYRGYSTFRFFWKWLIIAPVSWYFLTLIIAVFCNYKFIWIAFVVPIIIAAAMLIFGWIKAGERADKENQAIFMGNQKVKESRDRLIKENESLKVKLASKYHDLEKFNDLVPPDMRKSSSMSQIKSFLLTNRASSFESAVKMLSRED